MWPHNCCFVECHFQYLCKTVISVIIYLQSRFFPRVSFESTWCNHIVALTLFNLSGKSDFYLIDNLLIAFHSLPVEILTWHSINEILLPWYMNWSIHFRNLPLNEVMAPFWLKHMSTVNPLKFPVWLNVSKLIGVWESVKHILFLNRGSQLPWERQGII